MNRSTILTLIALPFVTIALLRCGHFATAEHEPAAPVLFGVFNVGQGLAQIVATDTNAILFDAGPGDEASRWRTSLASLGSMRIGAIVISHFHEDHWGGLRALDSAAPWGGCMVVSPYVDTAALRAAVPVWRDRIKFRTIAAGDTLLLPGGRVDIRCIWPPENDPGYDPTTDAANAYSLVFMVEIGETRVLITSDIDSSVTGKIGLMESDRLKADILVVPHHGSRGSLDKVFYGYVRPSISIVSYGEGNEYGHPSNEVLLWLSQTGSAVRETALDGACFFNSNGRYWQESEKY